jgi:hypothetical protein
MKLHGYTKPELVTWCDGHWNAFSIDQDNLCTTEENENHQDNKTASQTTDVEAFCRCICTGTFKEAYYQH